MNKKTAVFSMLTLFLPVLCGALLWNRLPDRIATHFDINGVADGYSGKTAAVFVLPLILAAVQLACIFAVGLSKRASNVSGKVKNIVLWLCPVFSAAVFACIYGHALGRGINIAAVFTALIGLEFIILGNYMPKTRQNRVIGIRIPWTLADETNWNRTHRFAGKIMVVCGFAVLLNAMLDIWSTAVSVVLIFVCCIIPIIYSVVLSGKNKGDNKIS